MKICHFFIISILFISLLSCKNTAKESRDDEITENSSSEVQVDHFNIWVSNPKIAKKRLTDIGFTSVPDSLSEAHKGQGTAGKYFNFLNGYLELIFFL